MPGQVSRWSWNNDSVLKYLSHWASNWPTLVESVSATHQALAKFSWAVSRIPTCSTIAPAYFTPNAPPIVITPNNTADEEAERCIFNLQSVSNRWNQIGRRGGVREPSCLTFQESEVVKKLGCVTSQKKWSCEKTKFGYISKWWSDDGEWRIGKAKLRDMSKEACEIF